MQVVTALPRDDREGTDTVREQVERRWLGSVSIPFSTLYHNTKLDGALRLRAPHALLGYSTPHDTHTYLKVVFFGNE